MVDRKDLVEVGVVLGNFKLGKVDIAVEDVRKPHSALCKVDGSTFVLVENVKEALRDRRLHEGVRLFRFKRRQVG